jgi:phage terminase small subunit
MYSVCYYGGLLVGLCEWDYMARYRRVPSELQRRLAIETMNGKSGAKAVTAAGYSKAIAHNAHKALRSRGYLLAMQQQAEELGYISTAFINRIKILIGDGALDEVDLPEALKMLEKVATISDKYANLTGFKKQQVPNDGLDNIIDIG